MCNCKDTRLLNQITLPLLPPKNAIVNSGHGVILHDCYFGYFCGTQLYNAQGQLQIQHSTGQYWTLLGKPFSVFLFPFKEINRCMLRH